MINLINLFNILPQLVLHTNCGYSSTIPYFHKGITYTLTIVQINDINLKRYEMITVSKGDWTLGGLNINYTANIVEQFWQDPSSGWDDAIWDIDPNKLIKMLHDILHTFEQYYVV